mgnify:CR=1 FL=1
MNDWEKIKQYYIKNDITLEELAKKFKVSVLTVNKESSKGKWKQAKRDFAQEVVKKSQERLLNSEIEKRVAVNDKHIQLSDCGLTLAERYLEEALEEVNKRGKRKQSPYTLKAIMETIAIAQKIQRTALSMDKEEEKEETQAPKFKMIEGVNEDDI